MRTHLFAFGGVVVCLALSPAALCATTTRVSVDSAGNQANSDNWSPSISLDGRFVAFDSAAMNLVPGDTNAVRDAFVHDRATGVTTRVSVDSAGTQANAGSDGCSISADGRLVAFHSWASNLVPADTNSARDVFVHDRLTGTTTRVSVDPSGAESDGVSGDPSISSDGRYVAFGSDAGNLVGDDTNGEVDVFVHDRQTGTTVRVSVSSTGTQGNGSSDLPAISGDGRFIAFESRASNLVTGDTNGMRDVFVHDRQTGATTRASVDGAGNQGDDESWYVSISGDGRLVAFSSLATNLVSGDTNHTYDAFVRDRTAGTTTRVSVDSAGNQAGGLDPCLSPDGRYVAFESWCAGIVPGHTSSALDMFLRDRQTGAVALVSTNSAGDGANGECNRASVSADGRFVAFASVATNLVPGDTNGVADVFVHERWAPGNYRPDGLIYNGTTYLGDNVYNTTGVGQTQAYTVSLNQTATYHIRFYNDGELADSFLIAGSAGSSYWRVRYYDYATGTDITGQVTGAGWVTPSIGRGLYRRIRVEVTPIGGAGGNTTYSFPVNATSTGDGTTRDTVRAATTCAITRRPDGLIHNGSTYIGDNVYNTTGLSQTHSRTVAAGTAAVFHLRFYNDGNVNDSFRISGPSGSSNWQLRYVDHATGTDITSSVTLGGWATPTLGRNVYRWVRLEVTPLAGAPGNSALAALVTATSIGDTTRKDTLKAVTTCLLMRRPDGLIYNGSAYLGDGIYNTSGAGQTHSMSVATGTTAVYHVRLQNDGNVAESYRVTGVGGSSAWRARYYDYATGIEITTATTGGGWVTPTISPRLYRRLRVEVTPLSPAAGGTAHSALLTATSLSDGTRRDAIKAVTTCLPCYQPDALIHTGLVYLGNDVYNTTGAGQTRTLSVEPNTTATYHMRFYNDGNLSQQLRLTGSAGGARWDVQYLDNATGADITSAVTGAGWLTPTLGVGVYRQIRVLVTPTASALPGEVLDVLVTGASTPDTSRKDAALARTTRN